MKTTPWTPGPWTFETYDNGPIFIGAPGAGNVCHVLRNPLRGDVRANARLIALAPEMVDELESFVDCASNQEWGRDPRVEAKIRRIRALLREIRGRRRCGKHNRPLTACALVRPCQRCEAEEATTGEPFCKECKARALLYGTCEWREGE